MAEKVTFSQRLSSFGKFLYNGENGTVLGRSGRSWAEIGIFYVIYYCCLAAFFAATLAVFYQTLDSDNPKLQGSDSLLKGNPGMGFQPMPDIDTTLIYSTPDAHDSWAESIEKVLKDYKDQPASNLDCSMMSDMRTDASDNKACNVNYTALTAGCTKENKFGMMTGDPCVLIKLNKIYGWKPELYTKEEIMEMDNIPDRIKNDYREDRVYIDCHGENAADNDNLRKANVEYFPQNGFPLQYYPYMKQENYISPLVFVKFNKLEKHLAYMIECKAIAKNINVDRTEKEGSVHFELLID